MPQGNDAEECENCGGAQDGCDPASARRPMTRLRANAMPPGPPTRDMSKAGNLRGQSASSIDRGQAIAGARSRNIPIVEFLRDSFAFAPLVRPHFPAPAAGARPVRLPPGRTGIASRDGAAFSGRLETPYLVLRTGAAGVSRACSGKVDRLFRSEHASDL